MEKTLMRLGRLGAIMAAGLALAGLVGVATPALADDRDEGRCVEPQPKPWCPKGEEPVGVRCRCGIGDHSDWCRWETVCQPKPK